MKKSSTLFLKIAVSLGGLAVLALCIFVLPALIRTGETGMYLPILVGMYAPAIPFFIAVYQTLKLLRNIDQSEAFSLSSIKSLDKIKYSTLCISVLYGLGLPYIFMVADRDDAPGAVLLGLIFTIAPLVIAVFANVLARVFQNAMDLKSENELAV